MGVVHSGFDHVTMAVTDLDGARQFFALLGFEETTAVVVSGDLMSRYMGIPDWEADHVTLRLTGAVTHQEVQLLRFHRPVLPEDPQAGNLARLGFNHVCFAVDDIEATLAKLAAAGIGARNETDGIPRPEAGLSRRAGWRGHRVGAMVAGHSAARTD